MINKLIFCILILFSQCLFAAQITLDLQDADLSQAMHIFAKLLNKNIILSPAVHGKASLHLHHADADAAFNMLLLSNGLAAAQEGNTLFIAPEQELIKRKLNQAKWEQLNEITAPLMAKQWQIQFAKAGDIVRLLNSKQYSVLSKRGQLYADERTNTILMRDTFEHLAQVNTLIRHIDKPIKQVMIEARLINIDDDIERELGIDFRKLNKHLVLGKLSNIKSMDIHLAALEESGQAELISNPRLYTANQEAASIETGEEVPYQQVSESGGTAIAFKKAVLGLTVTPQILPHGYILLKLKITQDRPSDKMILGMPTIRTRQIITNVIVQAGQTIVLGGIFELNEEKAKQGLPIISHIPLIGVLFEQNKFRKNKRELLIFVTPTLLN